jgi:tetratricopeptide (TPR) repeat protein
MPRFDLKESPFYTLRLSPRQEQAAIAAATEQAILDGTVDEAVAANAQQILLSPRRRLAAELSWLPGVPPSQIPFLLDGEKWEEAAFQLADFPGANLAAHHCYNRRAAACPALILRFYANKDDSELLNTINAERRASGFPEASVEMLCEMLPALISQHVDALAYYIKTLSSPGQTLTQILQENFGTAPRLVEFLDALVERFNTDTVNSLQDAEAIIGKCLASASAEPDNFESRIGELHSAIEAWAELSAPRQFIHAFRHLKDERTGRLLAQIRETCLSLNNELGQPSVAAKVLESARAAFVSSPEHLEQLEADLKTVQQLAANAVAFDAAKPLLNVIANLNKDHRSLSASLKKGHFRQDGKGQTGELFRQFRNVAIALAGGPNAGVPFRLVLSLAIELHNDSSASDEALILISALRDFKEVSMPPDMASAVKQNGLTIYRVAIENQIKEAASENRHRQCAKLARELVDAADNDEDRKTWSVIEAEFERRHRNRLWKIGGAAAAILAIGIWISQENQSSHRPQKSTKQSSTSPAPTATPMQQAAQHYREGERHLNAQEYADAIRRFDAALVIYPQYADAYVGRGEAFAAQDNHVQAILEFGRALDIDARNANAVAMRGRSYVIKGDLENAIRDTSRAIELRPTYGFAYLIRGVAYRRSKQHNFAFADFDKAVSIDPSYPVPIALRGSEYAHQLRFDAAIADFNRALELNPQLVSAVVGRSLAQLAKGNLQDALADCNLAMRMDPSRKDLVENRGLVYLRQKKFDLARADFDAALVARPESPWAIFGRGITKLRRSDVSGGRKDIATATSLQSDIGAEMKRYGIQP